MDQDELRAEASQPENGSQTSVWAARAAVATLRRSLRRALRYYFLILYRDARLQTATTYQKLELVPEQCPKCGAKPPPPLELFSFGALLKTQYSGWHVNFEYYPFWPIKRWKAQCLGCCENAARGYMDHVARCLRRRQAEK